MVGLRNPYSDLEKQVGYRFRRKKLLETALTHRSFRFENDEIGVDNQRLEFLGDAVLGFAVAAYVYKKFDDVSEGVLTAFRSQTTSGQALAEMAREIHLGDHVRMGKGERRSGGKKRPSTLADTLESVVGAAYLDGGLKGVQKIMKKLFIPRLDNLSGDVWEGNPKGQLQEQSQRRWKTSPKYRLLKKSGPPHAAVFSVEVTMGRHLRGTGQGRSKQVAETQAAMNALQRLRRRR